MHTTPNRIKPKQPSTIFVRLPFYYGWIILLFGSAGILASIPGQTMGVSVFTDHLIAALELSRIGVSTAYMIGTLASSLLIPFAGILFDRWGARITGALATLFLSLFLILLAFSHEVAKFVHEAAKIPSEVSSLAMLILGFFGIRFCGQGVLTLVSRGMVAKWFGSRRGLAVGIMGLATAFGFSYAPQPLQNLIDALGWQGAYISIALFLGVVFFPLAIIFYRSEPASCALEIEQGMRKPKKRLPHGAKDAEIERTAQEAKREPIYWIILALLGYWTLFNTAFTFHVVSIFEEVGLDARAAVSIFLPMSVVSVITQFIGSYLSDRIPIRHFYTAFAISMILASFSVATFGFSISRLVTIGAFGAGNGLFGMLTIVTWPKLFGKQHIGAISGFAMSIMVAGSAVGPWLFSLFFRFDGSYAKAGSIGVVLTFLLLIAILFVKHPVNAEQKTNG